MIYKALRPFFYLYFLSSIIFGQSGILIMSPEPNSEISGENFLIAASLFGISNIDLNSISLSLDGEDITDRAYIDSDMISCLLEQIEPGNHQIVLTLNELTLPTEWTFSSLLKDPSVTYSGRIRSSSSMDQIDDKKLNISKVAFDFKGSAYNWLNFRTNLKLTTQENLLYQPRNIYGFSFQVKDILKVNFGDTNPRLTHFTMNGKRVRGVDTRIKYGWVNLHVVKGEINRSVEGSLKKAYLYNIDTDDYGEKYLSMSRSGYTFERNVFSARLGIGRGKNFEWGLSFMKARDDTNSVEQILDKAEILYLPDASGAVSGLDSGTVYTISDLGTKAYFLEGEDWIGDGPKDNLVMSSDVGISLFNKRLRLDGELAFSLTNNNIWGGPLTIAALDTMIDDSADNKISTFELSNFPDPSDYEDIIIINENMSPLVPIDINAFGSDATVSIMDAVLSMPSLAYHGKAVTNFYGNYLAFEYNQVGPEFNSLANPYLVKNKRGWSISDKLKLLQNRLMLTIGYKHQDDNILTSVENIKSQNTTSFGLNALLGPGLPVININYRLIERENGIVSLVQLTDTTFTDNRNNTYTNNLMINVSHKFNLVWSHSLSGTFVNVNKKDKFQEDRSTDFIDPSMSTNVINCVLSTRYNSPLKTIFNITSNSSELSTEPGKRGSQNLFTSNFDTQYPFLNNKLLARGGVNIANGTGMVDMSWVGFKGGLRWMFMKDLSLNASGEFRSKKTNGISKNTIIARANLDYSF